jgi:L-methionine (R)-S-oxide reductase
MKQTFKLNKVELINSSLTARIIALCNGEDDEIAIMATVACELYHGVNGFDWVGFYRVVEPGLMKIGPYQGPHGCLDIPFARGVCGAAARDKKIIIVDDVKKFDGHIACSDSTRSELVIPCFGQDRELLGVLDIDSDQPAFFSKQDADGLDQLMRKLFMGEIN